MMHYQKLDILKKHFYPYKFYICQEKEEETSGFTHHIVVMLKTTFQMFLKLTNKTCQPNSKFCRCSTGILSRLVV